MIYPYPRKCFNELFSYFLTHKSFPCRTTARASYSYQMKANSNKDQFYIEYHIDKVRHRHLHKDNVPTIDSRLPWE